MAESLLHSPLDAVHRAAGAVFTDFGGWELPLRFGSELAEHKAVRTAAGLFDLSHMAQFDLVGWGAGPGLDYALMGDHSSMPLGRASYSMILAPDGGVIDDLIVYRLGEQHYFVISNAANRLVVGAALKERLAGFDTTLEDITLDRALIAVQGPASLDVVSAAGLPQATQLGYYRAMEYTLEAVPIIVARTGYTGENGFEISCPKEEAQEMWGLLAGAGAEFGLVPCGLACRDTLRLEAGMPLYGHELDLDTTPIEGGQGAFVRDKAATYVGGPALQTRPVRKHLVGLRGEGRRAARAGYPVLVDGQVAGHVTSGALSPTLGYPIALASIEGAEKPLGSAVAVDVRGSLTPYTVVKTPFYIKEKK
ncbi:MAG: glycine cleavage system aminomethyltransferase GcvT [Bifidobacteriaceae bacterium]|jgi:aminomethyltransferase|nr:glycine cleavage system aminomethyltransferase GcvT [Bifidobacteriaceae bacterium]